jgi:LiaF transmembrane domain
MSSGKHGNYVIGILLIVVAILLILNKLMIFDFSWPFFPIAIGVGFLVDAALNRERGHGGVFVGTLMLMIGLIFLSEEQHWFLWGLSRNWPLFIMAPGIAFIVSALYNKENASFIPGGILVATSAIFILSEHRVLDVWIWDYLDWWPVALLALGVFLIFHKRRAVE